MPAKELLKQNDVKFRLLFEVNPLPMWVYDRETLRFVEANQAAVAHYGYSREEFLRHDCRRHSAAGRGGG